MPKDQFWYIDFVNLMNLNWYPLAIVLHCDLVFANRYLNFSHLFVSLIVVGRIDHDFVKYFV